MERDTAGRPIRALFISHDALLYGAQRSLLSLLARLDQQDVLSHLVVPYDGGLSEAAAALDIPVVVQPLGHWVVSTNGRKANHVRNLSSFLDGLRHRIRCLCALIDHYAIDLIYTNTVSCVDGALAARAAGRPHVWHLREHVRGNRDLAPILPAPLMTRLISSWSDHVIFNSYALRDANRAIPSKKSSVVHNGIDPTHFANAGTGSADFRRALGVPEHTRLVVIIGSITPSKGLLTFIEAADRSRRRRGDAVFLVVGHGQEQYVDSVKAVAKERGLDDCLQFLGWRADVAEILQASDVLVVAADKESFGRTVIEAMAAGVPVVSTRCGGPEETVVHGETGFLVPIGDPRSLADAVETLLSDPALARRLGTAGRARVEMHFTEHAYARSILGIIARVAREAPRTARHR